MTATAQDFKTPGQLIEHLLQERGWTQRILAQVLGLTDSQISKLVTDKKGVDAETAILLGDVFRVEPESFLDLQKNYDLAKARLTFRRDRKREIRAELLSGLPVREMITRGWLDVEDPGDLDAVETKLARFFGVDFPEQIEVLPHVAKKTEVSAEATPEQIAWLYRVKQVASQILVTGPFSEIGVRAALKKLDFLLAAPEEARQVPRILSDHGIRFVVVESLKVAKIDGVCFWLDERSPVIGMTLRHDRMDNFWFVLRHELEHVIRGHGKRAIALDAELEGESAGTDQSVPEQERIANAAAANFCVPQDKLQMFIERKAPIFADRDVRALARMLNIHPSLIVGQLQWRTQRYNLLRKHLVRVRSYVLPGSFVDGWGDVFPINA